jgi:hypothetical protein
MVIDEADEMLDADWQTEFNKILCGGGKLHCALILESH